MCAQWVPKDPSFLHADNENSDQTADLSLLWVHMPLCWFSHEAAQFVIRNGHGCSCLTVFAIQLNHYHCIGSSAQALHRRGAIRYFLNVSYKQYVTA